MKFLQRLRLAYGDMKLSSKFTLVLMITATIPVIMMAGFFYSRLYDMVVSYTIQQEQDTSAQTAPYVEEIVQKVIDAHDGIAEQKFFQTLFHQPVNSPSALLFLMARLLRFIMISETSSFTPGIELNS